MAKKYAVIDESTQTVVSEGHSTRQAARLAKRDLDYKASAANGFRNTPSHYYVESDVDHPKGAGIYYH